MRAVLDPNVLIAAALSRTGAPARLLARWLAGEFELVDSDQLLAELERALAYPKLRKSIPVEQANELVRLLRENTTHAADPPNPQARSHDPGDDYLLALAEDTRAVLVSGDQHLLALADRFPVRSPRHFLEALDPDTDTAV